MAESILTLKRKYRGQWLAIKVTRRGRHQEPVSGQLVCHAKTHRALHRRLTDPNVYSRPWTGRQFHNLDPKYVIFEYACHEGNWRYMEMTLGRGRLLDAEEAAAKKTKGQ